MIIENRRNRAHIDWPLILMVFGLAVFGVLAVCVASYSTSSSSDATLLTHIAESTYAVRQVIFVFVVAPAVLLVLINVPYDLMKFLTPILFVASVVLLFLVWILNRAAGVKAWLDIIWGFTLQPS